MIRQFPFQNVFLDVIHGTLTVLGPVLIDHAKGALIVRISNDGLHQKRVGLAGRTVYGAFVAHRQTLILQRDSDNFLTLAGLF
jgi:hypothetical protein